MYVRREVVFQANVHLSGGSAMDCVRCQKQRRVRERGEGREEKKVTSSNVMAMQAGTKAQWRNNDVTRQDAIDPFPD